MGNHTEENGVSFPINRWLARSGKQRYAGAVADSEGSHADYAPVPGCSEDGVDITLVRWMLSLTPAERLQFLQERIEDVEAIRELNAAR